MQIETETKTVEKKETEEKIQANSSNNESDTKQSMSIDTISPNNLFKTSKELNTSTNANTNLNSNEISNIINDYEEQKQISLNYFYEIDPQCQKLINMIFIIDKEHLFEEFTTNKNDIKLNTHIHHLKKNEIYFYVYDYSTSGGFAEKNGIYSFKCADENCCGSFELYLDDSQDFSNQNEINNKFFKEHIEHSFSYEQHCFSTNPTIGQQKYKEIMKKYPNIKHIQIISVPENFNYNENAENETFDLDDNVVENFNYFDNKNYPKNNNNNTNKYNNFFKNDNNSNINIDEDEEKYRSDESEEIYEKENDSDSSSYRTRSRNNSKQKRISKKIKIKPQIKKIPKQNNNNTINEKITTNDKVVDKYLSPFMKPFKKKRRQLYYKPQEYSKFEPSRLNPKYYFAYMPYYKKGREAFVKSKARDKWMKYMTLKYGKETSLGPIYYKDKNDGKIYKFAVNNLSSDADNRKVTYNCFQESCQARGVLFVECDRFVITEKHSLRRSQCTDIKRHQAIVDFYNAHPNVTFVQTLRVFTSNK